MIAPLRPMELGEIVDRSATFWRVHWRRLYGLFFAFNLVQFALLRAYQAVQARVAPLSRGGAAALEASKSDPGEVMRQMGLGLGGMLAMLALVVFLALVETVAATRYTMPVFLGQTATVRDGLDRAWKRAGATAGLFLLACAWSLGVLLLCLLPSLLLLGLVVSLGAGSWGAAVLAVLAAVAMGLGLLVWALWFIVRFALWAQVLAMEDVGPVDAFRRCAALSSGRVGPGLLGLVKVRLTVLITVVGLLLFMITFLTSLPTLVLQAVYGNMFDPMHADPDAVPQALMVPAQLLSVAVNSAVYPFYVAFQTIFYVDMRSRREGLDLELQLQQGAP